MFVLLLMIFVFIGLVILNTKAKNEKENQKGRVVPLNEKEMYY